MKQDWRNIKLTDVLFTVSVVLICLICTSAMSFLMPYRIFLVGIFGIVMFLLVFMKNKFFLINPLSILMLIFITLSFSGLLFSLDRTETMKYSLVYLCMVPMVFFNTEGEFFNKTIGGFKIIIFVFACTIIMNAVIPNLFLTSLNVLIKPGLNNWIKVEVAGHIYSGMAGEKGEAAMLMVIGMAVAVSEFVRKRKITMKDALYTVVITIALILPAKRSLFVVGVFFIVVYILFWIRKDKKLIAIAIGILITMFLVVYADHIPGMNVLLARFIDGQGDESLNGRSYLWERAVQMFQNKPIFGYGYGSYNTFASYYGVKTSSTGEWFYHAHNVYLQLLAEMGIIGAGCFFGMMLYSIIMMIVLHARKKFMQVNDMAILAFSECMQIWFMIDSFTANCLYTTNLIVLYMFVLASVVYLVSQKKKNQRVI